MKVFKPIMTGLLCVVFTVSMFCSCNKSSNSDKKSGSSDPSAVKVAETIENLKNEDIPMPDLENAVRVKLNGSSAEISGSGASVSDGAVTVTDAGTYVISGKLSNGRVIVNAPKSNVILVLDGADINCKYGSPLYIYKSALTTVYLNENTENALSDGSSYTFKDSYSSSENEEPNACLYSKSDLIIAGKGKLTVSAAYNNGITCKDTLKIISASVSVEAENHGINGKDYCAVKNADIKVVSGGDSVRSTNDTDSSLGYIVAVDSSFELTSGEDGMQAETSLSLSGCVCKIVSGGSSSAKATSDISSKGIKAGADMVILSGTYTLDCCDDAIHSNGNMTVSGGTFDIATGDDGIHADETVSITGGAVAVSKSYEGIEGNAIEISGGNVSVTASDDGLNAAGGKDQSGFGERKDAFSSSNSYITISGGVINIDASGDGIDSNGNLTVSGGEIYVNGPTSDGDSALDYDGTAKITGGIIVAVGSSGMAQNFGEESTQGSMLLSYQSASNAPVTLKDSSGNILVSFTPNEKYKCVVISCPSVKQGETYTVTACGQTTEITMSSLIYGNSSGMGGHGGTPGNQPNNNIGGRPGGALGNGFDKFSKQNNNVT